MNENLKALLVAILFFMLFFGGCYAISKIRSNCWEEPINKPIFNKHYYTIEVLSSSGSLIGYRQADYYYETSNILTGTSYYHFRVYSDVDYVWNTDNCKWHTYPTIQDQFKYATINCKIIKN